MPAVTSSQSSAGRPTLVALPGTGSDADYCRRAFGRAARLLDAGLVTPEPRPDLIAGHLAAVDEAASKASSVIVGGVSIGAAIAVRWALDRPAGDGTCIGVLAALPPWSGVPDGATAAASAIATADSLRAHGVETTIATMAASSPRWLADELTRSWRRIGPDLETQLRTAATFRCPTPEEIAALDVPLAIVGAVGDAVHPIAIARDWDAAAPCSALAETTLDAWGADAAILGDLAVEVYLAIS